MAEPDIKKDAAAVKAAARAFVDAFDEYLTAHEKMAKAIIKTHNRARKDR